MKIAIISPTPWLEKFSTQGDLHLVLAHKVLEDRAYADFYTNSKLYKILDSSVYELGTPVEDSLLIDTAMRIKADEITLPDYPGDASLTVKASQKVHVLLQKYFPAKSRMIIPQGETIQEWFWCLKELLDLCTGIRRELVVIGLPFRNCNLFSNLNNSNRPGRVNISEVLNTYLAGHDIHLLGGGSNPVELSCYLKGILKVRSVDSAIPIIAGALNERFDEDKGWERKGRVLDWNNAEYTEDQVRAIQFNIHMIKRWSQLSPQLQLL